MNLYQRIYYNLHRLLHLSSAKQRGYEVDKRISAVKFFFFIWHLFYGLAIAGWATIFSRRFFYFSDRQSGNLLVGGAILSVLLMLRFFPTYNQLRLFNKHEQKRVTVKRDAEMVGITLLFFLSIAVGYWLFITSLQQHL